MPPTIEQIDRKIAKLEEVLKFWQQARQLVENPLFAELSSGEEEPPAQQPLRSLPPAFHAEAPKAQRPYGQLKKLTLECLPLDGTAVTPQELTKRIEATGFKFVTKTPAISVNDTLRTLDTEKKVKLVGKSPTNANLWSRVLGVEKEAPVETS